MEQILDRGKITESGRRGLIAKRRPGCAPQAWPPRRATCQSPRRAAIITAAKPDPASHARSSSRSRSWTRFRIRIAKRFSRRLMLWKADRNELAAFGGELDSAVQMPGWTNVWTMPIQNRVDMLSTGVNTPIGIRVLGRNLDDVIRGSEEVARVVKPLRGAVDVVADPDSRQAVHRNPHRPGSGCCTRRERGRDQRCDRDGTSRQGGRQRRSRDANGIRSSSGAAGAGVKTRNRSATCR